MTPLGGDHICDQQQKMVANKIWRVFVAGRDSGEKRREIAYQTGLDNCRLEYWMGHLALRSGVRRWSATEA